MIAPPATFLLPRRPVRGGGTVTFRLLPALGVAVLALGVGCAPAARPLPEPAATSISLRDTSWVARSTLYEVFVQNFSAEGNLRGVIAGLDRIEASGANTVWLMPIHPIGELNRKGELGSPYAVRDFQAINPRYGTLEDFRALVAAVHERGMNLILDWVPNHTAADHPWVSSHPEFYVKDERGAPSVPRDPEGKLTDWTDVLQLDYGRPELRREMIAAMRWWLEEQGIDGFRMDIAGFVPYAFWREALPALRAAVPRRILLLAEWGDPEMHRAGFDLTYAWDAYHRLKRVWQGGSASEHVRSEVADLRKLPPGAQRLRFTTNHDETAWDNPPLMLFGGSAGARAAFVATALMPGRPLLYNGQEVESPQKPGLFSREPVGWNQPDSAGARAFYRRVMELTETGSALTAGAFTEAETSAPDAVISFRRDHLLVLVNTRSLPVTVSVRGFTVEGARDLLTDRVLEGAVIELPGYGAVVLTPGGE